MPIVRKAARVRWRGRKGKAKPGTATSRIRVGGVDGLGQVEAAEAVDVAGDPPALADRLRQARELVLEQDDVGDALGHLGAGAHRHRHPRLLQRRHVVDAVADHRHVAAGGDQGGDQRLLLLRLDPAEDRVGERDLAPAASGSSGRSGPSTTPASRRHADRVGDRGDGGAGVAGDQLQVDFLLAHVGDRLRRVGRAASPPARPGPAASAAAAAPPRRRPAAPRSVSPKATTRRPAAVSCSSLRARSGGSVSAPASASTSGAPIT